MHNAFGLPIEIHQTDCPLPFDSLLKDYPAIPGGGLLYLSHIKGQTAEDIARSQEALKQWEASQQQTEKATVGDTSQGNHGITDYNFQCRAVKEPVALSMARLEAFQASAFYRTIVDNNLFRPPGWTPPRPRFRYRLIGTLLPRDGDTPHRQPSR